MKKNRRVNSILIFSGLGIQIGASIYFGAYLGKILDLKYNTAKPYFALGIVTVVFAISMYALVIRLNKMNKDEEE
mgnify:CR=1 FL=1